MQDLNSTVMLLSGKEIAARKKKSRKNFYKVRTKKCESTRDLLDALKNKKKEWKNLTAVQRARCQKMHRQHMIQLKNKLNEISHLYGHHCLVFTIPGTLVSNRLNASVQIHKPYDEPRIDMMCKLKVTTEQMLEETRALFESGHIMSVEDDN